jgi:hypothetical protein
MRQVNYSTNNPLTPTAFLNAANRVRQQDPSRPTYANFGKCFAIPNWNGCQTSFQTPEPSYDQLVTTYCASSDIVSSDYYANNDRVGAYNYGLTVDNMRAHCGPTKPIMFDVETGNCCGDGNVPASSISQAVWVGILHGANGVAYFVDDFNAAGGQVAEDGLLQSNHADALAVVTKTNQEVASLAPQLNSPSLPGVTVSTTGGVPVTTMLKSYNNHLYLFAIADGNPSLPQSGATTATFTVSGAGFASNATVINENRTVGVSSGRLTDTFAPYQVHIYQIG